MMRFSLLVLFILTTGGLFAGPDSLSPLPAPPRTPPVDSLRGMDVFTLEARRQVLTDRLKMKNALRDSLMDSLAVLSLPEDDFSGEDENGFGITRDPRKSTGVLKDLTDPERQRLKNRYVGRLDTLKSDIKDLDAQMRLVRERIREQLKGR